MAKEVKEKKESKVKGNSFGASGFTLGILSVLSMSFIGILTSIVGLTFCIIQQKNRPTKLGKVGLILNVIGLFINLTFLIWYLFFGGLQYLQSLNNTIA